MHDQLGNLEAGQNLFLLPDYSKRSVFPKAYFRHVMNLFGKYVANSVGDPD